MRWRKSTACERASQWISLGLDGELTELERAALARHLERCATCNAAKVYIGGFTDLMRSAPPAAPTVPIVVAAPGIRRRRVAWQVAATVSIAVGIAGGAGLFSTGGHANHPSGALGFSSVKERIRFARFEHIRVEPRTFVLAELGPTPQSLASRMLR